MENIEELHNFIEILQKKTKQNDRQKAQKDLIDFYFKIHNNEQLTFTKKKIQTELVLEQLLYILDTKNSSC